jgi:hypothetical protein
LQEKTGAPLDKYKKDLFLLQITQTMQLLKLSLLSSLLFTLAMTFGSCEKEEDKKSSVEYVKTDIVMSYAQETPAPVTVPSGALGSLDVFYSKSTRTLNYKITWSGLLDSVIGVRIHGLAPVGYATANVVQTIVGAGSGTVFPQKTQGKFTYSQAGTISGTLLVDGVKVKEEDLLNGLYYINVLTNPNPSGEIRGQIRFQ